MVTYDELVADRAKLLRELSQGEGLTLAALQAIDQELAPFREVRPRRHDWSGKDLDLSSEQLFDLLVFTVASVAYTKEVGAMRVALGMGETDAKRKDRPYRENLTERRHALLEHLDITLRTLIRHEQEGAETIARHYDTAWQMSPNQTFAEEHGIQTSWMDRPETAAEQRISELEVLVAALLQTAVDPSIGLVDQFDWSAGRRAMEALMSRNAARAAAVSGEVLRVHGWRTHLPWEPKEKGAGEESD